MSYDEGAAALTPGGAVHAKAAPPVQRDAAAAPATKPKRVFLTGLSSIVAPGNAIAIVHPGFDPKLPADVLLHLHGYGGNDDALDKLGDQLMQAGNPQMIGLRPSGSQKADFTPGQTGASKTAKNAKAFDADAFVTDALGQLVSNGTLASAPSGIGNVVMSAHSGGGDTLGQILDAGSGPKNVGEVMMFDAINPPAKDELPRIESWLHGRIAADVTALLALGSDAERSAYLAKSLRFRAFYSKASDKDAKSDPPNCYAAVHAKLEAWLQAELAAQGAALPADAKGLLGENYKVVATGHGGHSTLVGQGAVAAELKALVGRPKAPAQAGGETSTGEDKKEAAAAPKDENAQGLAALLRAGQKVRDNPDELLGLRGSEIAWRMLELYLPKVTEQWWVSGAGGSAAVSGVKLTRGGGKNVNVTLGLDFMQGTDADHVQARVAELSAAFDTLAAEPAASARGGEQKLAGDDPLAAEAAKLEAAGRAALANLPKSSAADASKSPGAVGQGEISSSGGLPDWFMEIQSRLVMSSTWGEAEEAAQHAIRDYANFFAKKHAGPGGKVPGHLTAFFDYIGRGSKNDAVATKAGYKGSSALGGSAGAKNWCAGAATSATNIAKKEGRAGVLADLAKRGLVPKGDHTLFFSNLAALSGAAKSQRIYGKDAYAEPLLPGDRVDYLFHGCQYGGHAVHVVADLGDSFLHVSGNTTQYSAVGTGAEKRMKSKPEGLNLGTATKVDTKANQDEATKHIRSVKFTGALTYSITRESDPYKALSMLETEDPAELAAALEKLLLKKT